MLSGLIEFRLGGHLAFKVLMQSLAWLYNALCLDQIAFHIWLDVSSTSNKDRSCIVGCSWSVLNVAQFLGAEI
jgi:hypothetical protein